jgi:ubiquitin carboxyl-terminal hydrolase 6/32
VIRLDGSRPTRYGIRLDGDLPVSQLKLQLSNLSSLSTEQIGYFDVTSSSYLRRNPSMENDQSKIKQLNLREFLAYELPPSDPSDRSLSSYIIAIHRRLERQERYLSPMTRHRIIFFGQPILIPYKNNSENKILTNEYVYKLVYKQLERLLRKNKDKSNHGLDCDDLIEERYPFTLKHVNEDGKKCSICSWNR